MRSWNPTIQDLLTLLQYVSIIRLKAVRSHASIRNRATVKMLKGNICSGNICAGGFSKPTAPLFCVDSCKHFCWLVVTLINFEGGISCHFSDHGSRFLHTAFLVTKFFFKFDLPPSLKQVKPWQRYHQGLIKAAKGMRTTFPRFISAFPKLKDPKQGPWLAWWGRESVVALALSWDIGQQGYATHLVGGNGSYRREKAGK